MGYSSCSRGHTTRVDGSEWGCGGEPAPTASRGWSKNEQEIGGFKQNLHKKKTQNALAIFANRQRKRQMNEKTWSKENNCEGEKRIVYLLLRLRWSEDTGRRRATTTTMSTLEDKNDNQRFTSTVVDELKQEEREQNASPG